MAVQKDGLALQHAADEFKSDRGIVLAAVHSDGWALEYASDEFKSDPEIVLIAKANRARMGGRWAYGRWVGVPT